MEDIQLLIAVPSYVILSIKLQFRIGFARNNFLLKNLLV